MSNLDDRIVSLEREVRRLSIEVGKYQARDAQTAPKLQTRLAKVTSQPSAGDTTFPVIFVETEDEVADGGSPTWTDRQTTSEAYVVGIFGDELPDDDEVIPVFWHDENWWTAYRKSSSLILVTADADIEHNATGTCSVVGDTTDYQVFNGREKLWQGAEALIGWNKTSARWQVVQAFSATRIRGTVQTSNITPGNTGTLGSLVPINGHFAPTTLSALLPTQHRPANVGMRAWAELVWTGTVSQWQIYNADCNG